MAENGLSERMAAKKAESAKSREVANRPEDRGSLIKQAFSTNQTLIAEALGNGADVKRFIRAMLTQIRTTPGLLQCTPESIVGASLTCAQLDLWPGPMGECWVLPYKNWDPRTKTEKWEATFQLGYKGMAKLFWQHPLAAYLDTQTVYENDEFEYSYGLNAHLEHKPAQGPRGNEAGYWYAVAKLTNGGFRFVVLTKHDVENKHRKFSKAKNGKAWTDSYNEMAEKSCIVELFKLLPKSPTMARAIAADDSVRTDKAQDVLDSQETENPANVNIDTGEIIDGEVIDERTTASGN